MVESAQQINEVFGDNPTPNFSCFDSFFTFTLTISGSDQGTRLFGISIKLIITFFLFIIVI